jgi:hypothetical protein
LAVPAGWWAPWAGRLLVRVSGEGAGMRVTGEDARPTAATKGCQVCAAPAVTLALAEDVPERTAFAPCSNWCWWRSAYRVGGRGQVDVLTAEGRSLTSTLVTGERALAVEGAVLHLGVVRYAQLDVQYVPGLALVLAGLLLAVLGGGLALALPERRLWALAAPEGGTTVLKAASDAAHSAGAVEALVRAFGEGHGA